MRPNERVVLAAVLLAAAAPALAGEWRAEGQADEPAPERAGGLGGPSLIRPPRQDDGTSGLQSSFRLWTASGGTRLRASSPYAAGAALAGVDGEANRIEGVLRLAWRGAVAEGSVRTTTDAGGETQAQAIPTELYQELDLLGQHLTFGQKVTGWDVAYGFRPLDVVQQERRLALRPFALVGIPQVAWEWFDERWAVLVLWANPLRGRALLPQHDESGAARVFRRLGPVDLHAVARFSDRTGLQAGAGAAAVVGEALELHGSARWQARDEHLAPPRRAPDGSPMAARPPGPPEVRRDQVAGVVGFTLTPGLDLSILGEAWFDPAGDAPSTWRQRRRLAEDQRALGDAGAAPAAAVAGNLAWGLSAFDRQDLLPWNLLLHVSRRWDRLEPALDLLVTPQDRGWAMTASAGYQGERFRFDGGLRILGGPPGAAHRLYPGWATFYVAAQLSL